MEVQANQALVTNLGEIINRVRNDASSFSLLEELKRLQVEYGNIPVAIQNPPNLRDWPVLGLDQKGKRVVFI